MALSGYLETSMVVKIRMSDPVLPGASHHVTFSGPTADPLDVTIEGGGSMTFDSSNWNVDQDLTLVGHRLGHIPMNYIVSADYTAKTKHGVFFVEIDPLPQDEFIPTGSFIGVNFSGTDLYEPIGLLTHVMGHAPVVFHQLGSFPDAFALQIYNPDGSLLGASPPISSAASGTYAVKGISLKGSGDSLGTSQTVWWDSLNASGQSHSFAKLTAVQPGGFYPANTGTPSLSLTLPIFTTLVGFTVSPTSAASVTGPGGSYTYTSTVSGTSCSYSASWSAFGPPPGTHGTGDFPVEIAGGHFKLVSPSGVTVPATDLSAEPVDWTITF